MNLAYHDAGKYADLYEETMYNALLGSLDLAQEILLRQSASSGGAARYPWHALPVLRRQHSRARC